MPDFIVTSPEGKKYRVTAPPGATQQDVMDRVRAKAASEGVIQSFTPDPRMSGTGRDDAPDYGQMSAGQIATSALQHAPGSAVQFAKDVAQPVLHPINTATNFKNVGKGILQKSGIMSGTDAEPYAEAVGQYFMDRYGSVAGIKKAIATDPVGVLADISTVLGGGAATLPGKIGKVAGIASRATNPLAIAGKVAGPVLAGSAKLGKEALGLTTGAGGEAISEAVRAGEQGGAAGQAFTEHMTGAAPATNIVEDAKAAVSHMRTVRGNIYRREMAKVGGDTKVLDFADIDKAVTGTVKQFQGVSGKAPAVTIGDSTATVYEKMRDKIIAWKSLDPKEYHTAAGFDALKQSIGDIQEQQKIGTAPWRAANDVYNAIKDTIVKQVPKYAEIMKGYEEASSQIKEIEKTLSLNPNANIDTSLRKLLSSLRDNVNTNYGRRKELVAFLARAGAPHLLQKIAGQSLNPLAPRGLARGAAGAEIAAGIGTALVTGNIPAAAAVAGSAAIHSPRLAGTAAYGVGKAKRKLPKLGLGARALALPEISVTPSDSR